MIGDISDINKLNDLIANYDKKVYNYFEELIDNFDFNIIISILNRIGDCDEKNSIYADFDPKSKVVLIVDDNPTNLKVLGKCLKLLALG